MNQPTLPPGFVLLPPSGEPPAAMDDPAAEAEAARTTAATRVQRSIRRDGSRSLGEILDPVVRSLARGTPIGSFLDEANAATNAALYPVFGTGAGGETYSQRYNTNIGTERARDKAFEAASPVASTALEMAGGLASGAGLLRAAPVAANVIFGNVGTSVVPRVAAGMGSGAVLGGVFGLGAGEGDLSERAGSAGRGALAGGIVGGAVPTVGTVVNAATQGIPGVRRSVGRVLEESVTPQAGARLRDLGPDAFLAEGSPTGMGYAQGVAIRPGPGKDVVVNAVTARHAGANARLGRELDDTLGPVMTPSAVEQSLEQQRLGLGPLYQQVTGLNQPVNLRPVYDQLRMAIPEEAGATQQALRRIMDMVAPQEGGQRIVRSAPREVLNVRQALDDEINRLGETPKAQRAVTEMRRLVDNALAEAVPDLKILDATFSNLSRESEALKRGSRVLQTGPEAIRPEELAAERAGMLAPQREAMRIGARAEIDRLVGTKANDATALKQLVQSEGDWNRTKLADIFGQAEADRILKAVDREVAFKDAYTKLVENSQTAQRQAAARKIGEDIDGAARAASLRDMTGIGLLASSLQKGKNALVDAFAGPTRQAADAELARVLMSTGPERDQWLRLIQSAQQKRSASSNTTRELLARAMYGGQPLDLDPAAILLGPHRPRPKRE